MSQYVETEQPSSDAPAVPSRPRRLGRFLQWSLNLAVFLVAVIVFTPAGNLFGYFLIRIDPPAKADYIAVLGGGPSRAVEAARLYRNGWASKVIASSRGEDADLLAEALIAYGVPDEAILRDRAAARTADHPRTIAALADVDPTAQTFLIVTSPFHTSRAKAVFLRAGYRNVVMRCPAWLAGGQFASKKPTWTGPWRDLPAELYESIGWGYYALRGWV